MRLAGSCFPAQVVSASFFAWSLIGSVSCLIDERNRPFAGSGHMQVQNKYSGIALGCKLLSEISKTKELVTSPGRLAFVLKVPLLSLPPSIIYSVPCDQILQRAYYFGFGPEFKSSSLLLE